MLGYDLRGRAIRKTVSAKTRAEALKRYRELQRTVDAGLPPPDGRLTVSGLLDKWLTDIVPLRVSAATLANYTSVVNTHIKPAIGRKRLNKLQPDDVQHLIGLKLEQGLAPRTVRLIRGLLVQAFDYATRQGLAQRNVAGLTEGPRQLPGTEGRSLSLEQAKKLLETIEGDRLEALYLLALSTGLRPGEVYGLPWKYVDLDRGQIHVRQALSRQPRGKVIGPGKTGRKGWRTIPKLPAPVVDALLHHRDRQEKEKVLAGDAWEDHGLVFCTPLGTPLDPDNQRKAFGKIVQRAGLGKWHPNELRHSAISILLAQGVPINVVSKVAGHSSIRITADVYGHLLEEQHGAVAEAMESALWEAS